MEPNTQPQQPQSPAPVPQTPPPAPVMEPPQPAAPVAAAPTPGRTVSPIVVIIGVVIILVIGSLLFAARPKPQQATAPTPTPTETPTPTPVRQPSALASQSAFLIYESSVASLSASIQRYNTQDPMLSPPVLTLPLGFSR